MRVYNQNKELQSYSFFWFAKSRHIPSFNELFLLYLIFVTFEIKLLAQISPFKMFRVRSV